MLLWFIIKKIELFDYNELTGLENQLNQLKSGNDYKNFQNLLIHKKSFESKLKEIEDKLFHEFSVLEKALKKYAKISFDSEDLINKYLSNPTNSLVEDHKLEIVNVLKQLKSNIIDNKLELDRKKGEKSLAKIRELDDQYFSFAQSNYNKLAAALSKIKSDIEGNDTKNKIESYNKE